MRHPPNSTLPDTLFPYTTPFRSISMDFVRTRLTDIDAPSWAAVTQVFHELVDAAKEWLADEKVQESQTRFVGSIEARYQGQNYEIAIPVDPLALPDMDEFLTHFGDAHQKEYGYRGAGNATEAVNCRITAIGIVQKAPIAELPGGESLDKGGNRTEEERVGKK